MDPWRRWETQAIRESRGRPGPSQHHARAPRPDPRPSPVAEPPPSDAGAGADLGDPGTMLVPIDAWNRILDQLGHLHQAGQELAEARERAARAETESQFLRERLAELRAASSLAPEGRAGDGGSAAPVAPAERRGRMQVIRSAYRDLRRSRR